MIKNMWIKSLIGTVAAVALMSGCGSDDDGQSSSIKITTSTGTDGFASDKGVIVANSVYTDIDSSPTVGSSELNNTSPKIRLSSDNVNIETFAIIMERDKQGTAPAVAKWVVFAPAIRDGNQSVVSFDKNASRVGPDSATHYGIRMLSASGGFETNVTKSTNYGEVKYKPQKYVGPDPLVDGNFTIKVYGLNFSLSPASPDSEDILKRIYGSTGTDLSGTATILWNIKSFEASSTVHTNGTLFEDKRRIIASGSKKYIYTYVAP